jgi:hypothetical protein
MLSYIIFVPENHFPEDTMMKFIFLTTVVLSILMFGIISNLTAETVIPGGNVSGTWTAAGSPYLIQGDLTIHPDSTLNIEPAVEVIFQGIYSLTVNGLLEAVGTETDSIHFIPADTASFWRGIHFSDAPDSSHLVFCTISHVGQMFYDLCGIICTNSNPVITHCRISDNTAKLTVSNFAGGITLNNSNPEISWCNIINNVGNMVSGGIRIISSSPAITGCNISDNVAQYLGGGISITGNSSPMITNCAIERNLTNGGYGGGIYSEGDMVTISECTFGYNEAFDEGGGISIHAGSVILDHCIFEHNQCQQLGRNAGGGVYISGDTLTVDHCTFYLNLADIIDHDAGLDIQTANSAVATISNSIFSGVWFLIRFDSSVPASVSYNDFQIAAPSMYFWGDVPPGLGDLMQTNPNGDSCDVFYNMYLDPLFVEFNNGDYHLTENSPCIDAGDPDSPYDPDSTIADLGAFFYEAPNGVDDYSGGLPSRISLSQNYPNPFNPTTAIEYSLPRQSNVSIEIFDILGRNVRRLLNETKSAGMYKVMWDGTDQNGIPVATGIYLYQIQANDFVQAKKMLLLK